jgi:hypothetical protein
VTSPARDPSRAVERTYLVLTLVTTLAASFIWGVNTLFLLNAGLSNTRRSPRTRSSRSAR